MNREEKAAAVAEIAEQIEESEAIFAVDYRGISVPQAAELRSKLRESDASFRVVKNRLTKLAAQQAKRDELTGLLEGPTALTFVRGDTASAAKTITTFNREHEILTFKGGFMADMELDPDQFNAIARLPGRDVLIGQFAGVVASPITGLVRGLGSMIQGLALQLGQIAEQGLVTGEAPAAEPEAPAEPEPAAEEAPAEEPAAETDEAPADEASEEPAAEEPSDEAPSEEPAETPDTPGGEAEDVSADGEPESPSEEPSTSDASATSEGDAPADTSAEPEADEAPAAEETSTTEQSEEE